MLRIAVADDETDMQDYFTRILPRLGHEVVCVAGDGLSLVEQCRLHEPDLIITDVVMPALSGIEAAEQICRFCPVPVIFVTAIAASELPALPHFQRQCLLLVKPIKQADLQRAIAVLISGDGRCP